MWRIVIRLNFRKQFMHSPLEGTHEYSGTVTSIVCGIRLDTQGLVYLLILQEQKHKNTEPTTSLQLNLLIKKTGCTIYLK